MPDALTAKAARTQTDSKRPAEELDTLLSEQAGVGDPVVVGAGVEAVLDQAEQTLAHLESEIVGSETGSPSPPASSTVTEARNTADQILDSEHAAAETHLLPRLRQLVPQVSRFTAQAGVQLLILADKPFASLSPRIKNVLGLAAVATFAVAVTTWIIGCF